MEPMVCAWCQCEPNACMTEPRPNLQKNVVYVEFQPRYSYEKHVELVQHWAAGFKIVGAFFPKKRTFFHHYFETVPLREGTKKIIHDKHGK